MECRRCGAPRQILATRDDTLCDECNVTAELREQVAMLKAERDEAVRDRREIEGKLLNLLARIHGDGGHYVAEHGVEKAVADADALVVTWHAIVDEMVPR